MDHEQIMDLIEEERQRRDYSKTYLSKGIMGWGINCYHGYLTGKNQIPLNRVVELAKALDLELVVRRLDEHQ